MEKFFDEKSFNALVELIAESWRMNRFTKNLAGRIADDKIRRKFSNQVMRFDKKIFEATEIFELEVLDFTGEEFDTGLPIAPINLGDFGADEKLFVETMLEPTIKIAGAKEIVKLGAAVLGRRTS